MSIEQPRLDIRLSRRGLVKASLAMGAAAAATPRPTVRGWAGNEPVAQRGVPIAATAVAGLEAGQVAAFLEEFGLDASRVRSGVDASRLLYRTIDPAGRPTTASALVVLPANGERDLRPVTWLHGTMVYRGDAASVNAASPDRAVAMAFAAAGYAVVAPDYLGLGRGPGFHPYNHAASAVTASVDALRAARSVVEQEDRRLDERVLVTGFSWGGRVTLELGRAIQDGGDPSLGLAALAPISGPYDFSGTLRAALAGEINAAPQYLAYLIVAWNRVYRLYDAPGEAFRAPFAGRVETLFDGHHTDEEIFAGIDTATPADLFTPAFMERLREPSGALARALREADASVDWSPRVPVELYAAAGDRDVPIANAEHAERELRARGAEVRLVDVGEVDHGGSVVLSLPRVLARFDELGPGQ